jgi:hypothetical protein
VSRGGCPELPEVDYADTCNNYYPTEQEYLENKAANTNTGGTLWTHFPKGSGIAGPGGLPPKDPYVDWEDQFEP